MGQQVAPRVCVPTRPGSPDDFEWQPQAPIAIDTFESGGTTIVALEAVAPAASSSVSTQPAGSHASQAPVSAPLDAGPARRRVPHRTLAAAAAAVLVVGVMALVSAGARSVPGDAATGDRSMRTLALSLDRMLAAAFMRPVSVLVPPVRPTDIPVAPSDTASRPVRAPAPEPPVTPSTPPAGVARRPSPAPIVPRSGWLSVNARPWANVWVDGAAIGETPIGRYQAAAGSHRVLFRHPEFGEREVTVIVSADEESYATVDFGAAAGR